MNTAARDRVNSLLLLHGRILGVTVEETTRYAGEAIDDC
jgi:hypothetical protein